MNNYNFYQFIDFCICHLLRELGFHKRSNVYFIKSKKELKVFPIRKTNLWKLDKYDWNGIDKYRGSEGLNWKTPGGYEAEPIFTYYEYPGYICTLPSLEQIKDFCNRNNIEVDYTNKGTLILSLIKYHRSRSKYHKNSFNKYYNFIINLLNN